MYRRRWVWASLIQCEVENKHVNIKEADCRRNSSFEVRRLSLLPGLVILKPPQSRQYVGIFFSLVLPSSFSSSGSLVNVYSLAFTEDNNLRIIKPSYPSRGRKFKSNRELVYSGMRYYLSHLWYSGSSSTQRIQKLLWRNALHAATAIHH